MRCSTLSSNDACFCFVYQLFIYFPVSASSPMSMTHPRLCHLSPAAVLLVNILWNTKCDVYKNLKNEMIEFKVIFWVLSTVYGCSYAAHLGQTYGLITDIVALSCRSSALSTNQLTIVTIETRCSPWLTSHSWKIRSQKLSGVWGGVGPWYTMGAYFHTAL